MSPIPDPDRPDRNLALELVRVTEAAALAAARLVGMGEKEAADQAAVDAMRLVLSTVHMDGVVVIGEGEKDEAPMLYNGEQIGDGSPPHVDIAVDPLEGTRLTALGMPNAVAVIALSARGTMFDPGPVMYMEKLAGGEDIADLLDLDAPLGETVRRVAERRGMDIRDVMVVTLDRPRHEEGMKAIRDAGARVRLITDGDVAGSLLAVSDRSPVSLLWGIGGTPEGVISVGGDQVHRRRLRRAPVAARRRRAQGRARAGLRPREAVHQGRPRQGRRLLLLRHRRDRRRRPPGRALPRPDRDHGVDRHALSVRHGAPGPRRAQPHEASGDHRRALRLMPLAAPGRSSGSGSRGSGTSSKVARRPTLDGARSRRASECRKACVTSTWIRDCVCV